MRTAAGAASPPSGLSREEGVALGGLIALFVITAAWWALAFWPVQDAAGWLARTRYVCFGVADTGLPDGGGWIGLVGGPIGMLAILVTGWGHGVRLLFARARTSRLLAATLAALVIGAGVIVSGAGVRVRQARAATFSVVAAVELPPSTYPRLDLAAPALQLNAHDGAILSLAEFRGRPVLVTFAYAHCQTVCPLVVKHALRAQELLRSSGTETVVLILTLDPWRDTPSRLAVMARSWGLPDADAWVLGGAVDVVERTLDGWQVPRSRDARTGEITHPSLVYVVDGAGRIAYASTGGAEALASLVSRL